MSDGPSGCSLALMGVKSSRQTQTLRSAGVNNGELLRISVQRALSPPTL